MAFIKIIVLSLFCTTLLCANAQSGKLPPFRMVQRNGKLFKAENLPMGKPILIVYFSPGCEHCEDFTRQLKANITQLKKASVAMVTYWPVADLNSFVHKFSLNNFSNIYTGTEGNSFFLRNYYNISQMPFVALYTKSGDLVKTWHTKIPVQDVVKNIQALK